MITNLGGTSQGWTSCLNAAQLPFYECLGLIHHCLYDIEREWIEVTAARPGILCGNVWRNGQRHG